jgi:hypothetical protein
MPKTTAKSKTAKKAAPARATTGTKRKSAKKPAPMPLISFQAVDDRPFFEFKVTQQTLYWTIFGAVAIAFALWVYTLDAGIQKLYDEIDRSTYSTNFDMPTKKTADTANTPDPTETTSQENQ